MSLLLRLAKLEKAVKPTCACVHVFFQDLGTSVEQLDAEINLMNPKSEDILILVKFVEAI